MHFCIHASICSSIHIQCYLDIVIHKDIMGFFFTKLLKACMHIYIQSQEKNQPSTSSFLASVWGPHCKSSPTFRHTSNFFSLHTESLLSGEPSCPCIGHITACFCSHVELPLCARHFVLCFLNCLYSV